MSFSVPIPNSMQAELAGISRLLSGPGGADSRTVAWAAQLMAKVTYPGRRRVTPAPDCILIDGGAKTVPCSDGWGGYRKAKANVSLVVGGAVATAAALGPHARPALPTQFNREVSAREAAFMQDQGSNGSTSDLPKQALTDDWRPLSEIWKLLPDYSDSPSFENFLKRIDIAPLTNAQRERSLRLVSLTGLTGNEDNRIWKVFVEKTIEVFASGLIQTCGREGHLSSSLAIIPSHFWRHADLLTGLEFAKQHVKIGQTPWFDVQVRPATTGVERPLLSYIRETKVVASSKRKKRLSPKQLADNALIEKMHTLISETPGLAPWAAARELGGKIGSGTKEEQETFLKRVTDKYYKVYPD